MPGEFESILTKLQGKLGKQTIKRASTINRPRPKLNVIQIKAINDFVKRNPRADGGSVNGSEQAALRKKVEELMDDGYEFGEAVREAMRQGYKFGGGVDAQKKGTEASREYFKNRPVNKPTPTFEGGTGKAKVTNVKFKNKTQEKQYIKILKDRFNFPKGSKEARKIASNADIAKKFGITLNNVERVNKALINKLNLKYPTQTYEGYEKIQRERDKVRKENIKKTSSGAVESKIKRDIKKVDATALANDVDIAHRASLKANANLGADYLTSSLGIDAKIVNQSLIKPTEQKLGTLYENQKKLIKNLKPGKVPKDIQKKIEKLNLKISELADRTDGVLQGVLVDEKTLKPKIYGVNYSKVLGFGLIDKPVSKLTQADRDLIKLNVGEQIKLAKKIKPADVYYKEMLEIYERNFDNLSPRDKMPMYQNATKKRMKSMAKLYAKYGKDVVDDAMQKNYINLDDLTKPGSTSDRRDKLERRIRRGPPSLKSDAFGIGTAIEEGPRALKKAGQLGVRGASKILGYGAIPLELYFMNEARKQGKSTAEILAMPLLMEGRVGELQDMMKLTPVERQGYNRAKINEDESLLDTDFYTPDKEGIELIDNEATKDYIKKSRKLEEALRRDDRSKPKQRFTLPNLTGILEDEV